MKEEKNNWPINVIIKTNKAKVIIKVDWQSLKDGTLVKFIKKLRSEKNL